VNPAAGQFAGRRFAENEKAQAMSLKQKKEMSQ
jgi:hypothetical protein